MQKRSKMFFMIFILVLLLVVLLFIMNPKNYTYKLKYNDYIFKITEVHEKDNYYFEIKINNTIFPFRININKGRKVINKIYYYKDKNYECILPLFNNKTYTDIECMKDGVLYNYFYLVNKNEKIIDFANSITEYDEKFFIDNINNKQDISEINFYNSDKINYNMYISTYKGIKSKNKTIELFKRDIYSNNISAFLDKYYVTADYNKSYEFNNFIIVNLTDFKEYKIKSNNLISFDSYIQGIVDNDIFIYDGENEKQYKIDVDKKEIDVVSNSQKIIFYDNGTWMEKNKPTGNTKLYFNYDNLSKKFQNYDKTIATLNYYYLFKKIDNGYELYRCDKRNDSVIKYITNVSDMDIKYNKDYIYYVDGDRIIYYSDSVGLKTVIINNDLIFNKSIKYYVY